MVVVCCGVLQCVAVRCSVLQCVAVCCSVLQCVTVCYSVLQCVAVCFSELQCVSYVAVCCIALQCVVPRTQSSSLALSTSISRSASFSLISHTFSHTSSRSFSRSFSLSVSHSHTPFHSLSSSVPLFLCLSWGKDGVGGGGGIERPIFQVLQHAHLPASFFFKLRFCHLHLGFYNYTRVHAVRYAKADKGFFAKEPYNRNDILQKRRIILRSLLIGATPYAKAHVGFIAKESLKL